MSRSRWVKVRRMLTLIILAIVTFVVLLAGLLWLQQPRMIFVPLADHVTFPEEHGLVYEDLTLETSGGHTIHAWYFSAQANASRATDFARENPPTILFCHGNAGNISYRLPTVEFALSLGANILLFDYRGYGKSGGSPSETNCYGDADVAYEWLRKVKGVPSNQIIVFGRSLGGAIAIDLASRVPSAGLVIESAFSSVEDMGKQIFPFLPISMILRYHFDSVKKIGRVSAPVLVCHSPDDEVIPYAMGQKLFEAASEPKRFFDLSGGHNEREYLRDPRYLREFDRILSGAGN